MQRPNVLGQRPQRVEKLRKVYQGRCCGRRAEALVEVPFVNVSLTEILKRSAHSSRRVESTVEDIFQIVIMIFVQSAGGQDFLWIVAVGRQRSGFRDCCRSSVPGRNKPRAAAGYPNTSKDFPLRGESSYFGSCWSVYVEVQDHGKGMSRERFAEVQSHGTGVGLRGRRERAHQLHGDLSIESLSAVGGCADQTREQVSPLSGTCVTLARTSWFSLRFLCIIIR